MQPSGPSLLSSPLASVADAIILSQSPSILCQCLLQPKYDPYLLQFQNSDFIFGLTIKNNIFCSNIAFGLSSLVEQRGLRDCELNKLSSSSVFVLSQICIKSHLCARQCARHRWISDTPSQLSIKTSLGSSPRTDLPEPYLYKVAVPVPHIFNNNSSLCSQK